MHYHLEVIMPPTDDVEGQLKNIMAPFDEIADEEIRSHAFWDWYVIGGRWAGEHLKASVDPDQLDKFYDALQERKVTVSGLTCGKQEIQPASQIPDVDKLWREFFPDSELNTCPLFSHFNDQYKDNCLDVDFVSDLTDKLTASRVIVAGPSYNDDNIFQAAYMVSEDIWNGCNHEKTVWSGKVKEAIEDRHDDIKNAKDEWREKNLIRDDWLAVTVDYHS